VPPTMTDIRHLPLGNPRIPFELGPKSVRKRGSRQVRSSRNSDEIWNSWEFFDQFHGLDSSKGERVIRESGNFRWRVATTRTAMRKEHKLKFPSTFYRVRRRGNIFRQVKKPDKRLKLFRVCGLTR
jgi:hypothetical protein